MSKFVVLSTCVCGRADEAARAVSMYAAEGLAAPAGAGAGRTRLDALLRCVERLYARDPLRLRAQYWAACGGGARGAGRAATLYKFVRLSGEVLCGALLAGYLRALASLAVPKHTWALLAKRDALSAYHLLTALARYHRSDTFLPHCTYSHVKLYKVSDNEYVPQQPPRRPGSILRTRACVVAGCVRHCNARSTTRQNARAPGRGQNDMFYYYIIVYKNLI